MDTLRDFVYLIKRGSSRYQAITTWLSQFGTVPAIIESLPFQKSLTGKFCQLRNYSLICRKVAYRNCECQSLEPRPLIHRVERNLYFLLNMYVCADCVRSVYNT